MNTLKYKQSWQWKNCKVFRPNRRNNTTIKLSSSGTKGWCSSLLGWSIGATIFLFPFKLNGIWSWWQYSFRFWTKWNSIWFKIEWKTVTTIISHSMWKEMEYLFSQCGWCRKLANFRSELANNTRIVMNTFNDNCCWWL